MKHIFTIHSPITFLCAVSVCKALELKQQDVIIISAGYKAPFEYGTVVKAFHEVQSGIIAKLRAFNVPKAYDRYIGELTKGEEFTAYIDLMHYWQRILVTNPHCVTFNFIEEGTASYLKADTLTEITHVAKNTEFRLRSYSEYLTQLYFALRSYNHRLLNLPFWPNGYRYLKNVTFFGFSKHCYPGISEENKRVVSFWNGDQKNGNLSLSNAIIWVEDSYNKQYVTDQKDTETAILNSVRFINEKYGKTHQHWVKLRPGMGKETSEVIPLLENLKVNYTVHESEMPLELIMANSENVVLIGARSSLLFYAEIMGHDAYSYFYNLRNRKHSAFEGMDFFWDTVKHIPLITEGVDN
ncbi:hypothetical protein CYPRO_2451 [Cyclonatronum proteinivorum]|uniref:Capsular polysaccharide biosynthesis protein n=1 Tax=Cyclonatronum proteinivorum TaxID=1457365 RepID=A0A345UMJ1_9BACT|nr:polysialyltransferase family glycosyltransferase [Cyclonatronum proteinivorum]AXJ01693.1 hypothetical protein CYPRO_2451 [Cyclonatronum proteinivorum]